MKNASDTCEVNLFRLFARILAPERKFYVLAIVYAVATSVLTLAIPFSVQMLITTLANTAMLQPIAVLAMILFVVLCFYGLLNCLQYHLMETFQRRFFARVTTDIVLRNIHADTTYFETINRAELANRYFDIMTIQKFLPSLMIGGSSLVLRAVVGLVLVSFYHPDFLVFNLIFVLCLYVIWRLFGYRAITASLKLSKAKYEVAEWLEELGSANSKFKSSLTVDYAVKQSEEMIGHYLRCRRSYFRPTFSQMIGFFLLYAVASAALLGVGGLLVVRGELTLGQLVAAELILSSVFYGMSKLGDHLGLFYDLCAAVEKISAFYAVPVEAERGKYLPDTGACDIAFDKAKVSWSNQAAEFSFSLPAAGKVFACARHATSQKLLIDLLQGQRSPTMGRVEIAGRDLYDYDIHVLRDRMIVIDSMVMLSCSMEQYLRLHAPEATLAEIYEVLSIVELTEVLQGFPNGLQEKIRPSGYPLVSGEILRLKLASALLARPSWLVLTELFDMLEYGLRQRILRRLCAIPELGLLCFSYRVDAEYFEHYLMLGASEQRFVTMADLLRNDGGVA